MRSCGGCAHFDRLRHLGGGSARRDALMLGGIVAPLLFQRAVGKKNEFQRCLGFQIDIGLPDEILDHVQRLRVAAPGVEVAHDIDAPETAGRLFLEAVAEGLLVEREDVVSIERTGDQNDRAILGRGACGRHCPGLEAGAAVGAAGEGIDDTELDIASIGETHLALPDIVLDQPHAH